MNAHFSINEIDALLLPYIDESPMLPKELVENLVFEEENQLKIEDDQSEYHFIKPCTRQTRRGTEEKLEK